MRKLNELYEILWNNIKDKEIFCSGLCFELCLLEHFGIINENEEAKIKSDIFKNMPSWGAGVYGWPITIDYLVKRKEFVQRRIKELNLIKSNI